MAVTTMAREIEALTHMGASGRFTPARSAFNDSRSEHPPAPMNLLQNTPSRVYNVRCSDKRPRTVEAAGGMAHEEYAS